MVQNIKKYFKNFLLISGGILMASCNTKSIENEQFDYSKYPLYNENVDSIEYKFNDKEISDPFYKGNVVYNESVLLTKEEESLDDCLSKLGSMKEDEQRAREQLDEITALSV